MRPLALKRHMDFTKAIRKRRIDRETKPADWEHDWYDNLHQYSKNKIHCSCPLCAAKSRINGWNIRDKRQIEELNYTEEEE